MADRRDNFERQLLTLLRAAHRRLDLMGVEYINEKVPWEDAHPQGAPR